MEPKTLIPIPAVSMLSAPSAFNNLPSTEISLTLPTAPAQGLPPRSCSCSPSKKSDLPDPSKPKDSRGGEMAVLIDGENISFRLFPQVQKWISQFGRPEIVRIYGDWSLPNMAGWKPVVLRHGLKAIHQFQGRKNSTDYELVMDAIELLHTRCEINSFCIVSSDADFGQLCLRLRGHGKQVIGFGEAKTSKTYREYCDEFVTFGPAPKGVSVKPCGDRKSPVYQIQGELEVPTCLVATPTSLRAETWAHKNGGAI